MSENTSSIFPWNRPQPPVPPGQYPISSPMEIIEVDVSAPSSLPSSSPSNGPAAANIGLIGPRGSGKSCYASALAAWSHQTQQESTSPISTVIPFDDPTTDLGKLFVDTVLQRKALQRTALRDPNTLTEPSYTVTITFKPPQAEELTVTYQDFPGEFYNSIDELAKTQENLFQGYVQDFITKDGLIFFVDGTARFRDQEYRQCFDQFMKAWAIATPDPCRMAIVVGKCDHAELWGRRHEPQAILRDRFPLLCQPIQTWTQQDRKLEVAYFATSVLGTLGHGPRRNPNAQTIEQTHEGTQSKISHPGFWRPFGLISPLYWLATKRMPVPVPGAVEPW